MTLPVWARPEDVLDLLRLSFPIAVSRASVMLMSLTDIVVLSQNAELEVPFVLNGWLLVGLALAVGMGILQGVQVFTAELSGDGRAADTGRVLRRGLLVGGSIGLLFMVFILVVSAPLFSYLLVHVPEARAVANGEMFDRSAAEAVAAGTTSAARILSYGLVAHMITVGCSLYLEALRRPNLVAVIMYFGVLVNLCFDLALVAGWWGMPKLGADGVSWATTGTRWALTIVFVLCVAWLTPGFRKSPPAPKDEAWRQNTVGLGGALANVAEFGGFNFTFVIATWVSLVAATLYGLSIQVVFFTFMLYMGLGTATSVRVAEAFGRHDLDGVKNAGRLGIVTGLLLGAILTIAVFVLREPLAAFLISSDPLVPELDLQQALVALLALTSLVVACDGLQGMAGMALRAQEIVWPPAIIQIGSYFVILLPTAFYLGVELNRGAQGVMEAVFVTSIIAAVSQIVWLEWKGGRRLASPASASSS